MLRIIVLMMGALIITAACGNQPNSDAPSESEEASETEENTVADQTGNDNGASEENSSESESKEASSEKTENEDAGSGGHEVEPAGSESGAETSENQEQSETTATEFDINDADTQESLMAPTDPENGLSFEQDVITKGMTQTEVEDLHGQYDFIYPGHGRAVTIYGNLGVVYSVPGPYGEDELATTGVNPDEVIVENVMYYAGVSYDEVVAALGEPDVDAYEPQEGPVSGYHFMEYVLEQGEEMELAGVFWMHEEENGQLMADVMTKNEQPIDVEAYNESIGGVDDYTEETLTAMMEGYLSSLEDYFNDVNEAVFDYTEPSSVNGGIIINNKESGSFINHDNHNIEVLNIEEQDSVYYVTVAREYSHATSDGVRKATVEYEIFNTANGFKVMSFEELNDEPTG
ncbi:hypothetical protein [Salinicoccus sp. YB14-2]|uniref:hypothetical protein n=1 Tax=Salinicoccus sp. YB14-2 TaxID=1572701 RepID=UPI00068E4523|nr:hypothetical protein [Salinicoccus sp. YB14-2]